MKKITESQRVPYQWQALTVAFHTYLYLIRAVIIGHNFS